MKAIKVSPANASKIEAALLAVNGKSYAHAYTCAYEIEALASIAEAQVTDLVTKKDAVGTVYVAISGSPVSNSYSNKGYSRPATRVTLERRSTGWFLTDAARTTVFQQGGGATLTLTPAQDAAAVARFRKQYRVAGSAGLV